MIRSDLWVEYVMEHCIDVTQAEEHMLESVVAVLTAATPERQSHPQYEADCMSFLVATIEVARAVVRGDSKMLQVVKA